MAKKTKGSARNDYPKIEVWWEDIAGHDGWNDFDHAKNASAARCSSVGYLWDRNKKYIKLVGSVGEANACKDPEFADILVIPFGCVRRIKRLR